VGQIAALAAAGAAAPVTGGAALAREARVGGALDGIGQHLYARDALKTRRFGAGSVR
jgi:hypothetical protein